MEQKEYQIDWCENKTTNTGKAKLDATLKEANDKTHQNVTIWSDFPDYANLKAGSMVKGTLTSKDFNGKTYWTLNPVKTSSYGARGGSQGGIKAAMVAKEKSIAGFQANKEDSIKTSSTFRDATLLTVNELHGKNATEEYIKQSWLKWRHWLLDNYDVADTALRAPF